MNPKPASPRVLFIVIIIWTKYKIEETSNNVSKNIELIFRNIFFFIKNNMSNNKYKKANVIVKIEIKRFKLVLFHPCLKKNSARYFMES